MADAGSNVEVAHGLSEHGHHGHTEASKRHAAWLGLIEALVLAIVAVATAWSGYQASRWEGVSTTDYALYERYTVLAQAKTTLAGQDRLYDIIHFSDWLNAKLAGREKLAAFFERRFRPEYGAAFRAWLRLDPIHNPKAPPGPIFMPQYKDANALVADRLEATTKRYFDAAGQSRETADDYVRATVFLATVLFLTALSQRFQFVAPRIIVIAIAAVLLTISMYWIVTLPRA